MSKPSVLSNVSLSYFHFYRFYRKFKSFETKFENQKDLSLKNSFIIVVQNKFQNLRVNKRTNVFLSIFMVQLFYLQVYLFFHFDVFEKSNSTLGKKNQLFWFISKTTELQFIKVYFYYSCITHSLMHDLFNLRAIMF